MFVSYLAAGSMPNWVACVRWGWALVPSMSWDLCCVAGRCLLLGLVELVVGSGEHGGRHGHVIAVFGNAHRYAHGDHRAPGKSDRLA